MDHILVHGDFGPNNMLFDPVTFQVAAVVDWELAHFGDRIEDLAWCGWTVRMHHARYRHELGHFFCAYGLAVPAWAVRRAAMLARCERLAAVLPSPATERFRCEAVAGTQCKDRRLAGAAGRDVDPGVTAMTGS
jgi:hypothetical protein